MPATSPRRARHLPNAGGAARWFDLLRKLSDTILLAVERMSRGELPSSALEPTFARIAAAVAELERVIAERDASPSYAVSVRRFQVQLVRTTLERERGNVTATARALQVSRTHVHNLLRESGG